MKRILFMTHAGEPGGAEYKMLDLCQSTEFESAVLLLQPGSLERRLQERGIACSVLPMGAAAMAVRREHGLRGLLRAIPATVSMLRALARHARGFDMVVCFSQKSFVVSALAKPFMRRPICWFMNDILSREHFNPWLMRFLVMLSRQAADFVVLNSQASRAAWLAAGGRATRIGIVYPITRSDVIAAQNLDAGKVAIRRRELDPDDHPLVGLFGRISPWKGQDVFLRALAKLPGVRGVIAGGALFGEEAYEKQLRALAQQLGVADRVLFAGHIGEVPVAMAACDVVVHCSTSPEPFGRVIVESMLAGTPVIASDAGGAREIVADGETGQLTPMHDVDALAAAIGRYLERPQWSHQLAERARAYAEATYSPAVISRRVQEIFAAL